ncbi:MAG: murein biosynthesis integral membrane protein MurJ [Planctomycetes bacterium]|nr:murein biosynthesis integral membrane protein MurJ [Planctomycetota bacterium]
MAGLTLASRFAGLARDAVCSRVFGAGPLWSAFAFAFLVPNLFRRLFGEGALTAAFLPRYTALYEKDPHTARRFARTVTTLTASTLIILVLLGEVALWIGHRQTVAASHSERTLALQLTMIMLPYMPLVCLVALLGAVLQVHGRFGPTAAAPVILNIVMISAALAPLALAGSGGGQDVSPSLEWAVHLVALAVVVAGVIQLLWSILALRGAKPSPTREPTTTHIEPVGPEVRSMLKTMLPMLLGLGVIQLNTFFDGLIASYPVLVGPTIFGDVAYPLDLKSNAILSFTQRLYQFPLGVFGIAIATAIFPALARAAARAAGDDGHAFRQTLIRGLRLSLFISLPASIGLILVRLPLATTVFQGGNFEAADTPRIGAVLTGYAPGVCAYALIHLLTRAYYARDNATTPVRISVAMVVLNLILNVTLIWPMGEAGLAWSTSLCAWIQVIWLGARLRVIDTHGVFRPVFSAIGPLLASSAIMTVAVFVVQWALPVSYMNGWLSSTTELLALACAGIVVFMIAAKVLRQPELGWLLSGKEDLPS